MAEMNQFEKLAAIDVSARIEKKNGLSYLSWAWAVDQLLRADPAANWVYLPPMEFPDGTQMVMCEVTAFGKTMRSYLPVMDYRNKPIANPDAFATNTAMQRCLVKAIALHGLGLYIYAGEDMPANAPKEAPEQPASVWTDEVLIKASESADVGLYAQWWHKQPQAFRTAAIATEEHRDLKARNARVS